MKGKQSDREHIIKLPPPVTSGNQSLESLLGSRCSRRHFRHTAIGKHQAGQILWAAYGLSIAGRTCPSAGGLYPLTLYLLSGNIEGLETGLYRYDPGPHALVLQHNRDIRPDLCNAALGQEMLRNAPACLVYTIAIERVEYRYGERGSSRYIPMDIGHSAQNVYLQAESLGLGACAVGAFDDESVKRVLELPHNEQPRYMMPFGHPARSQ